jgi:hypothetical protein
MAIPVAEETSMAMSQVSSLEPPQSKYDRIIARAKKVPPAATLVVYPCDESSLRGAMEAAEAGIIVPTLVGPAARIAAISQVLRSSMPSIVRRRLPRLCSWSMKPRVSC